MQPAYRLAERLGT